MLIRVDPSQPTPLHRQISSGIRAAIVDGRLAGGERLPAARELAASVGVNMHTVLRAYRALRDEGLIELHRGRGAVVLVRLGGHGALAGAIHDLVDEAKARDLPEPALLELIAEAYRWTPGGPATGVRPPPTTRYAGRTDIDPAITGESSEERRAARPRAQ
ncbi:GntR family transcriptional regulator [Agromyces arachidis]|uniref:GntR family transcriptional regulator n=1 Tax=Agromyces arachidis TaxID=766966 RepID=UPI0040565F82